MGMRRRASACMCVSLQLAFMQTDFRMEEAGESTSGLLWKNF